MPSLSKYAKEILSTVKELSNALIGIGSEKPTPSDKKHVIRFLVQIQSIKKEIVKILFKKNGKSVNARERMLMYLKANVGRKVTSKELAEVANISEFARRIRELRQELGGWQISTGMNRPDLRPDEYVLENLEQIPVYERMNAKVWEEVLKRDNFTCQNCGWEKGDPQTNNRKFLEVHHKNPVKAKGRPTPANLITFCNVCHDAKEALRQ